MHHEVAASRLVHRARGSNRIDASSKKRSGEDCVGTVVLKCALFCARSVVRASWRFAFADARLSQASNLSHERVDFVLFLARDAIEGHRVVILFLTARCWRFSRS
jgi:hypothetical protein